MSVVRNVLSFAQSAATKRLSEQGMWAENKIACRGKMPNFRMSSVPRIHQALRRHCSKLPALARTHFDTANWAHHAETGIRNYKKTMIDAGAPQPFLLVIGGLFIFNFVGALPREMAHNEASERARFH